MVCVIAPFHIALHFDPFSYCPTHFDYKEGQLWLRGFLHILLIASHLSIYIIRWFWTFFFFWLEFGHFGILFFFKNFSVCRNFHEMRLEIFCYIPFLGFRKKVVLLLKNKHVYVICISFECKHKLLETFMIEKVFI